MMDHVMTCLEEVSGSGGSNSLRDKFDNRFSVKITRKQFDFVAFLSDVEISTEIISNVVFFVKRREKKWTLNCYKHSRKSTFNQR